MDVRHPVWDARGTAGVGNAFTERHSCGIGAEIMGAHKFGPPGWHDDLRAHPPRAALDRGGRHHVRFLEASPAEALETAQAACDGQDVRIGGGLTVVRDSLVAGLVDHMHLVQVPILLGRGVRLWDGLEALEDTYDVEAVSSPSGVTHLRFTRKVAP